ncbi:MAG: molybdopterin-dependent oxidoreductase [Solirubrobacterales bacterium]
MMTLDGARARSAGRSAAVVGAGVALLAAAVVHTLRPSFPFPPVAVADVLIEVTPGPIATRSIELLGHLAQPLLVLATTAAFLGVAAALGGLLPRIASIVSGRITVAALLLELPMAVVAVAAVRPSSVTVGRGTAALLLAPVLVLGAWTVSFAFRRLTDAGPVATERGSDPERRVLLRGLLVGAGGLLLGWSGAGRILLRRPDPGATRLDVRVAEPARVPPPSAGFDGLEGLAPRLTPLEDFYVVDTELFDPEVDADTWTLEFGGLVDRPFTLTYDELLGLPAVERLSTLECISNMVGGDLISTARFTGVPLRDLLERAGVRDAGVEVVATAVDGYADSISLDDAMAEDTLVVLGMNGRTLPTAHGYPARLLVPGHYGMKQPKWLGSIEVVDRPFEGYWETRGWSKAAFVKTMSRIDAVVEEAGGVVVAGVAFAGIRGISRVEVSIDDGRSWDDAELETALSPLTWRRWRFGFTPSSSSTVVVRGTDGEGEVQTQRVTAPHPDGASGYDRRTIG